MLSKMDAHAGTDAPAIEEKISNSSRRLKSIISFL